MLNSLSPKPGLFRRYFSCGKIPATLGLSLLVGASELPARTARAADSFAVKNGNLVGAFDLAVAELPPALSAHALIADPSGQDLYVLGLIGESLPGAAPTAAGVRYGLRVGRGGARIVTGPVALQLPSQPASGVALRGAVARSAGGSTLALGLSTGPELYFYDAATLAAQSVAALGTRVNLAGSGLAPALGALGSVAGLGSKIYAADAASPVVAQVDLMTGSVQACPVAGPVVGLSADSGKVVVTTSAGTAALADPCAATPPAAVGPAAAPPSPLSLSAAARSFELSERVLEMTFPSGVAGAKARRGLIVSAAGGATPTLTVSDGTCQNTKFYVGDPLAAPVAGNTVALTAAAPRLALYAEQTSPGEECVAGLAEASGGGGALLRIRGAVEGLGANVMLLDRSFSMERSLSGAGPAATPEAARVSALRQAAAALLGTVTVMSAAGPWAFLPFTSDVQGNLATPAAGFTALPELANPDSPTGMRVRGFAGASSDNLDPGGPGDLVQAVRTSLTRLASADQPAYAAAGPQRRLWILTDGSSGSRGYGEFAQVVPALLRGGVALHLTAVGALETDPLLPQLGALSSQLSGERLFAPARGQLGVLHSTAGAIEHMAATLARSVLRGRPVGAIGRGPLQPGQDLTTKFTLVRDKATNQVDPWVLFAVAWEDADAAVQLKPQNGGFPLNTRCVRSSNMLLCAGPGFDGDYTIALSGGRPGGAPTAAVLRTFVSSALGGGEVGFFPAFGRSLHRTGEQVRVQLVLNERGLPLRGAKVTARITGPSAALGTLVAQGAATESELAALIASNGDLTPGQAKGELLEPATLPGPRTVSMITLADDATGGDLEPQDGVYVGQFAALVPGVYVADIHAEYSGSFGNTGTIEDRLFTQVVVGFDQALTAASGRWTAIDGGVRIRFTPQSAAKDLLGPGQAGALRFAQGDRLFAPLVSDYLDGSYRADVTGIDTSQPFELVAPGSRIKLWDPADGSGGAARGCSVAGRAAGGARSSVSGLGLLLALAALRRRMLRPKAARAR